MKNINRPGKPPCATRIRTSVARTRPISLSAKTLKPSNNRCILIGYSNEGSLPPYGDTPLSDQQTSKHSSVGISIKGKCSFGKAAVSPDFLPSKKGAHGISVYTEYFSEFLCAFPGSVKCDYFIGVFFEDWWPDWWFQLNTANKEKSSNCAWIDLIDRRKGIKRFTAIVFLNNFILPWRQQ